MTSFANMAQTLGANLPSTSSSAAAAGGSTDQEEDGQMMSYWSNFLGSFGQHNNAPNVPSNEPRPSASTRSYDIWAEQSSSLVHSSSNSNAREYNTISNTNNNNQSRSREDVSSASPESVSISCCRCDRSPSIRCVECIDILCHECCYSDTSECQLRNHTILPIHQISPIGVRPNSVPVDKETVFCGLHSAPVRYYCETCIAFICQECTVWIHKDHEYFPLRGAIDMCRVGVNKLIEHAKDGTRAVKSAIDRTLALSKAFDREANEANMKIRKAMRCFIQAVEERETFLLAKVEQMRLSKANEIKEHTKDLKKILSGLSSTNENLVRHIDSESIDLFLARNKGKSEVDYFASVFKNMYIVEQRIIFQPPNYDMLEHIKNLADVQVSAPPLVQPRSSASSLRQSQQYSYAGLSYGVASSTGGQRSVHSIHDYTFNHTSCTNYYEHTIPPSIDLNCSPGVGTAIPGYSKVITLKPTRSPISGVPTFSFAREGQDEGQVSRPWGLCVDNEGNIIVADRRNNRIQIFNSMGHFKKMFGCKGTGPGEFDLPAGITTDHLKHIIVVDKDNHRVQIFTSRGIFINKFGSYGKECGQFQYPWDVAVNTNGNIVVTDTRNHRIQLFTNDGTFITKFVFETTNPAKMLKGPTTPRGVCFTVNGNIIVSDFENHRLLMVDPLLSKLLCCIGKEGNCISELNRPSGIVTDDEGRLIVADSKNHRVLVFTSELRVLSAVDLKSPGLDDKDRPSDVALTPEGHLVVLFETLPDTARDIASHGKQYIKVY